MSREKYVPKSHHVREFCTTNSPTSCSTHKRSADRPRPNISTGGYVERVRASGCWAEFGMRRYHAVSDCMLCFILFLCVKFHFRCLVFGVAETAPTADSTPPTHPTTKYGYQSDSPLVGSAIGDRLCTLRSRNLNLIVLC